MQRFEQDFRRLGARVVLVSLTRPDQVAAYLRRHPLPFEVLCDPSLEAYRAFGLGRVSGWTFFRLDVVARYLAMIWRGTAVRKPHKGDDLLQLGGDFVFDNRQRLAYAYRSREPTDRPSPQELLQAVEVARQSEPGG